MWCLISSASPLAVTPQHRIVSSLSVTPLNETHNEKKDNAAAILNVRLTSLVHTGHSSGLCRSDRLRVWFDCCYSHIKLHKVNYNDIVAASVLTREPLGNSCPLYNQPEKVFSLWKSVMGKYQLHRFLSVTTLLWIESYPAKLYVLVSKSKLKSQLDCPEQHDKLCSCYHSAPSLE